MVTHYSTILPLPCLSMQERTGLRVFTELWAYVLGVGCAPHMSYSRPHPGKPCVRPSLHLGHSFTAPLQMRLCRSHITCTPQALAIEAGVPGAALTRASGGACEMPTHLLPTAPPTTPRPLQLRVLALAE